MPLERVVDHLVLLNPALALESFADDARTEMIAVASEINDNDLCIWKSLLDKTFDLRSGHCHRCLLLTPHAPLCKVQTNFQTAG
jgi:hypothetical protein